MNSTKSLTFVLNNSKSWYTFFLNYKKKSAFQQISRTKIDLLNTKTINLALNIYFLNVNLYLYYCSFLLFK